MRLIEVAVGSNRKMVKKALDWLRSLKSKRAWRLEGYDVFAGESYPLEGSYGDEKSAQKAARNRLKQLERDQPTETSGGQGGIQDRVVIIRPDGTKYYFGVE